MKSWIYFARHGTDGPIKIGRAYDPHKRMRDLAIGSPVSVVLLGAILSVRAVEEEDEIHTRLREHCIRGEWFAPDAAQEEMRRLEPRLVSPEDVNSQETVNDHFDGCINVRVTRKEIEAWKAAARAADMSLSQWARNIFNANVSEEDRAL